jgi:uracil-DNA glycosylase
MALAPGWAPVVEAFLRSDAGLRLTAFLQERMASGAVIYPPRPLRALEETPLEAVHAVILGQDPYHGPGQAEGLAFSVPDGVKPPPSLRNIFKELHGATARPANGSLVHWARHGVLLLNTCLTVEQGQAGSHAKKGWEAFTDGVLDAVAQHASPCAYLLWGAHAQAKAPLIERAARSHGRDVLLLQANHPSPLSAARPPVPFVGCGHFAQARDWLAERGHPGFFA